MQDSERGCDDYGGNDDYTDDDYDYYDDYDDYDDDRLMITNTDFKPETSNQRRRWFCGTIEKAGKTLSSFCCIWKGSPPWSWSMMLLVGMMAMMMGMTMMVGIIVMMVTSKGLIQIATLLCGKVRPPSVISI